MVDEGQKNGILGELTVSWEESIAEFHAWRLLRYEDMIAEIRQN